MMTKELSRYGTVVQSGHRLSTPFFHILGDVNAAHRRSDRHLQRRHPRRSPEMLCHTLNLRYQDSFYSRFADSALQYMCAYL